MHNWILYSLIKRSVTVKRTNKRKTSELSVTKQTVSLVGEILSGCVRLVLAIGLCIAGCDLAKSMKTTSHIELSKNSEKCETMFHNLTNDIMHVSQKLASFTKDISRVADEFSLATNALHLSKKTVDDLKDELESACAQMKDAEAPMMCCTNKVNRCLCPCCWFCRW